MFPSRLQPARPAPQSAANPNTAPRPNRNTDQQQDEVARLNQTISRLQLQIHSLQTALNASRRRECGLTTQMIPGYRQIVADYSAREAETRQQTEALAEALAQTVERWQTTTQSLLDQLYIAQQWASYYAMAYTQLAQSPQPALLPNALTTPHPFTDFFNGLVLFSPATSPSTSANATLLADPTNQADAPMTPERPGSN